MKSFSRILAIFLLAVSTESMKLEKIHALKLKKRKNNTLKRKKPKILRNKRNKKPKTRKTSANPRKKNNSKKKSLKNHGGGQNGQNTQKIENNQEKSIYEEQIKIEKKPDLKYRDKDQVHLDIEGIDVKRGNRLSDKKKDDFGMSEQPQRDKLIDGKQNKEAGIIGGKIQESIIQDEISKKQQLSQVKQFTEITNPSQIVNVQQLKSDEDRLKVGIKGQTDNVASGIKVVDQKDLDTSEAEELVSSDNVASGIKVVVQKDLDTSEAEELDSRVDDASGIKVVVQKDLDTSEAEELDSRVDDAISETGEVQINASDSTNKIKISITKDMNFYRIKDTRDTGTEKKMFMIGEIDTYSRISKGISDLLKKLKDTKVLKKKSEIKTGVEQKLNKNLDKIISEEAWIENINNGGKKKRQKLLREQKRMKKN